MRTLVSRILSLFIRRRLDDRLDEEVAFHLEMLAQAHMREGMTEKEARQAARRHFGGVTQMKETYRDQRGLPFLETVAHDARYAVRTLMRTPGFTAAALLTLALGIGANSAIFSVVNAVLLRPLPYEGTDRIAQMYRVSGGLWDGHTYVRFNRLAEGLQSADAAAAWRNTAFNAVAGDQAEYLTGLAVSKDYFRVFGGTPLHGRVFEASEDVPNGPDVVILRHELWRRMFGEDPAAVGTTLILGDKPHTIVGVMPPGFDSVREASFYVPLRPSPRGPGGGFNYRVAVRLKPGVTLDAANAELQALYAGFAAEHPKSVMRNEQPSQLLSFQESLSRGVRPALLTMLGAVGVLLLIACANTASLLLARASGRGREISVRAALGAARGRIVRQLVTESMVLFFLGGLLGVALAYWAVPALLSLMPAGYLPPREVAVDGTVLLVTLGVSLVTGLIFGLAPALSLSRHDLVEAFKEDGTRTTGARRSNWLRRGLVVGEVALCMLLLVGAGVLIQAFLQLRSVDLGFNPSNVLTARMSLMGERYATSDAANRLFDRGLERIRQIPGVQSAAVVNGVPIETGLNLNFDRLDTPEREVHLTDWRYASAGYFETMGIPIVRGRGLDERDTAGAPRVTVVSQEFATRYFPDSDPIGQRIMIFKEDGPMEIVGIARDLREAGLSGPVPAVMYVPAAQAGDAAVSVAHMYFQVSWVVRAAAITPELMHRIREELRAVDPRQPITAFRSMNEVKARAMATETFQMALLTALAGVGLLLAAAGIYGLIAYSVAQRTREFGIRLALGASRQRILRSVLQQAAVLALAGVVTGIGIAVLLTRAVQSVVFGVTAIDATTVAIVSVVLLAVALLASAVPAMRAVRLNPVTALRE